RECRPALEGGAGREPHQCQEFGLRGAVVDLCLLKSRVPGVSFFFFQAEDGIRDFHVTGVQTCALPIFSEGHVVARRTEDELDGNVADPLDPFLEVVGALRIGDGDDGALAHEETRQARGCAPLAETDDRHAPSPEFVRVDLLIEQDGHPRSRPMKPSCVPYRPCASRARYDQRSAPPLFVQIPATSISGTPSDASWAAFADQRSKTILPSRSRR